MREKQIEKYLVEQVEAIGGRAIKLTSSANRGLPDRMCLLPGSRIWFVELKTPTGKLSALQAKQILSLRKLGQNVTIIDSIKKVDIFIHRRRKEKGK